MASPNAAPELSLFYHFQSPLMSHSCTNDDTLGPVVHDCRDGFDFTIRFEQVVLSIVPAAIFIVFAGARVFSLLAKKRVVTGAVFQWLKLSFVTVYAGLRLGHLVLTSRGTSWTSQYAILSDTLGFVVGLLMIPLSFLEHARSPRPSILLGVYLLITILFDIAQSRTLWLSADSANDYQLASLSAASAVVKTAILLLESRRKPQTSYLDWKQQSPEATSSIFSLATYSWVNGLLRKGFRKLLVIDDLYLLDEAMTAQNLYARFEPRLEQNTSLGYKHALLRSLLRTVAVPLFLPVIPRLFRMGFSFCQPLMIESLLNYLQEPEGSSSPNKGYGYIGAAVVIFIGMAVSNSLYFYFHERFIYTIRGILASAVYRNTTKLKLSAADDTAVLTLMSADIERIRFGTINLHEYWANPLEAAIACWLLYRQIGVAFLAPVAVVVICAAATVANARFTGRRQAAWMQAIERRVGVTAKTVSSMKALKISAMSLSVEDRILALRREELAVGGRWRILIVAAVTISFLPALLGPVAAFAATQQTLGVTRMFTSVMYLMLLAGPLSSLFQFIPHLVSAFTCLGRIQAYLNKEARVDFRRTPDGRPLKQDDAVSSQQVAAAITVKQGSFGWVEDKKVLNNIDLVIPASCLTIIVGPIASGKSTLLKALLGETPFNSGDVILGVNHRRVGYCDQSPFLYNDTVKANIIGHAPFDAERYKQVTEATMLSADLATLPRGDHTRIGSSGVTLSGGQRQRVALARALYLETELLIFDDVLSGLDATTEAHVFRRVFGSDGIVRQRGLTAVLCTHSVRHLPSADHIIALGADCTVVEQGTFAKLQGNGKYIQSLKIKEKEEEAAEGENKAPDDVAQQPLKRSLSGGSNAGKEPDKARQMGDLAVYSHYFGTMRRWVVAVYVLWCCIYAFTRSFPSVWLKFWSDAAASPQPAHPWTFYMSVYAALQVSCLVSLALIMFTCLRVMIVQSGVALHARALRTLIGAPLRFFGVTDAGDVTNYFAQDVALIDSELPMALINFSTCFSGSIGVGAVIATSSPWLLVTYPFLIAAVYAVQMFYLPTSRQLRLLDLEAKGPLYSHFIDTLKGLATIRATGFIAADITANNRLLDRSQRPAFQLAMIQRWLTFALKILVAVLATTVVTLATQMRSDSGFTGAALVMLMSFGDSLTMLVQSYTMLETTIGAVARLRSFSATVAPETAPDEDVIPEESWPEKGGIEITSVSASYGDTELALRSLYLSIRPGEHVAVCGRTGSGKSSLVLLLLRLLDPVQESAGSITVDSVPLAKVDRDTLRRRIIAVAQDPIFLPDGSSASENLDPFREADEAQHRDVLARVGLLQAIEERGGLDAALAPDALSQGQKQLFCLARAVLRRRVRGVGGGVLLLDEVSSSVDRETEAAIHEVVRQEFEGYTVVMVAHRLDAVMNCDTVVVMDKGRVAEVGGPRELKESEGGMFRELWNRSSAEK